MFGKLHEIVYMDVISRSNLVISQIIFTPTPQSLPQNGLRFRYTRFIFGIHDARLFVFATQIDKKFAMSASQIMIRSPKGSVVSDT